MASYQLKNNELELTANSLGAELVSVKSEQFNLEYIWQANPAIWARHSPNLFPIVGKLKGDSYTYQHQRYTLTQHGFARDAEFTCIEQTEDTLTFELVDNETSLINYPFYFKLHVSYLLIKQTIRVSYKVVNTDTKCSYFSIGAHPAFNCPLQANEKFEDYELHFPGKDAVTINCIEDGLISERTKNVNLKNQTLNVSTQLFENDALVFANNQINQVQLLSKSTKHGVSLTCDNWPCFGIWSKKNTQSFVCLEPWFGIADFENTDSLLTNKKGIITINPNEIFQTSFQMKFF